MPTIYQQIFFGKARLSHVFSVVVLSVLTCLSGQVLAIQASPHPIDEIQPDGSKIRLFVRGDEHFNWYEDENGFTVLRDRATRRYVYAELGASQRLQKTDAIVGRVRPESLGLTPGILPPRAVLRELRANARPTRILGESSTQSSANISAAVITAGTVKNLVILVRFSNHLGRTLPSNSDINTLFNAVGGDAILAPTGSVYDAFIENSYGDLTLDSTVIGWIDVPNTEQYYANGDSGDQTLWEALRDALDDADITVNFNDYDQDNDGFIDAVAFIHSGYGAEWGGTDMDGTAQADRIWSHKWAIQPAWTSNEGVKVFDYHISPSLWSTSGSDIGRIGVIVHETSHFLGLPDLYDIDQSSDGIGSYGLMANSWGFDQSQHYPPHLCAWSKVQLGWVTPTVISTSGTYNLPAVETSRSIFRIDSGFPVNEYLLIENRQPLGTESIMPQGGLAIWHIDDSKNDNTEEGYPGQVGWPGNGNHYQVALLQADGNYHLEKGNNRGDSGDVYHAGGVSSIGPLTVPNTNAYQSGNVVVTNHVIQNISTSSNTMSFDFDAAPPPVTYYERDETVLSSWIDASSGTNHPLTDDSSVTLPIGFNFDFFENTFSSVTISANGYLTFGSNGTVATNAAIPSANQPNNLVALYWDDLNPDFGGNIYSLVEGYAPNRRLTVSWVDVPHYNNASSGQGAGTFEVTLYEASGDIIYRYLDVNFDKFSFNRGRSATVGVENSNGSIATQHSYNTTNSVLGGDVYRYSLKQDVLLIDDDDDAPDTLGDYTTSLTNLGRSYSVWDVAMQGAGPDAATLAGYKSAIWFTGADTGGNAGPNTLDETELSTYLDAGGCVVVSSQDYHLDRGLTPFMTDYLGVAAVLESGLQATLNGVDQVFSALPGPYALTYAFSNASDTLVADASAKTAFVGNMGVAAVMDATPVYRTTYLGFPFSALATLDRDATMTEFMHLCNAQEYDTEGDGLDDALEMGLGSDINATDSDGDTISDFDELNYDGIPGAYVPGQDLHPALADTDGDDYHDNVEINGGTDPLDADSNLATADGDINSDGLVNTVDLLIAVQIITGQITPNPSQFTHLDVAPLVAGVPAPDGNIGVSDLLQVMRKVLGLTSF
ncbi:MAG TPA: M6 family metalloprotease domain-containing protein [Chromatiales bacterium]|nr:M6 family metalloprotease domain-containing protein [Chromatiales bacterium]